MGTLCFRIAGEVCTKIQQKISIISEPQITHSQTNYAYHFLNNREFITSSRRSISDSPSPATLIYGRDLKVGTKDLRKVFLVVVFPQSGVKVVSFKS